MPDTITEFLRESTAIPGLPGFEKPSAELVRQWFGTYSQDVWQDPFYNTFARMGGNGPKVMVAAHADGLGLMVRSIEDDGFIGFVTVGGFDPRVLPGLEVTVHGRAGDYFGVVAVKPPHVLSEEDRKKVLTVPELFIDIGYPAQKVRELVSPGDIISLRAPFEALSSDVLMSRALDDRAGIAVMLEAMRLLKKKPCEAQVVFTATTREEIGGYGAKTGAFTLQPDLAVVIDVTHAYINKTDNPHMVPYDKPALGVGPVLDRRLSTHAEKLAQAEKIPVWLDVVPDDTSTDGDGILLSRAGVPFLLLELPLRYMHTTVECLHRDVIAQSGKLLAHFLRDITSDWEDWPCI